MQQTLTPTRLVSSADRETWLNARTHGITATQVAKLAQGRPGDRREILQEKITGSFVDLTGNRYVDRGNEREPVIAAWIQENFDIEPNSYLYAAAGNPRHLATPDGIGWRTAEIKTTKHDLTPGPLDASGVLLTEQVNGTWRKSHYYSNGYADQVQWQLYVMGGDAALFAWEQHNDRWPNPKPIYPEPKWAWINRDQKRIDELIAIADEFLIELDRQRSTGLAPLSDLTAEEAQLQQEYLIQLAAESLAKQRKTAAYKALQELYADRESFTAETPLGKLTWTRGTKDVVVVNETKMREKAPRLVAQFESLRDRYTVVTSEPTSNLKITAAKTKQD